ncbi:MAG: carbon monoxide dehydrogenase subunit G [Nocardioidaceae bacterium]
MKIIGNAQFAAERSAVWLALNDPAVLVQSIPGCHRLEALGDDAYAMTVAAGVGSIKGVYDGQVRLTDQQQPGSFRMHAQGAGAAGTIGADVLVTLEESAAGGTSVTYDADAVVGGMIGGVGQRMLVGVSKRMAAEFFGNVEAVLAGVGAGLPANDAAPPPTPAEGAVFTAPLHVGRSAGGGGTFTQGIVVGAAAALVGALVGGWISRRGVR